MDRDSRKREAQGCVFTAAAVGDYGVRRHFVDLIFDALMGISVYVRV